MAVLSTVWIKYDIHDANMRSKVQMPSVCCYDDAANNDPPPPHVVCASSLV